MLRALWALCFLLAGALWAELMEYSPNATALSGISLLSDSVADGYLSPTDLHSGISCYYLRPYNMGEIPVYGLSSGFKRGFLHLNAGSIYLNHPDYKWHNPYLNLAGEYRTLALGAGLHLDYSLVADSDPVYLWALSLGAKYRYRAASLELKAHKLNLEDGELSLAWAQELTEKGSIGLAFVRENGGETCFKAGAKMPLNSHLKLYGSWQNSPARFGAGLNLNYGKWQILYSLRSHPRLAYSQAWALEYAW